MFDLPCLIEHDANAGALGDWWFGSASMNRGTNLFLGVSSGIGAGIISHGRLFYGKHGIAGEVGHMSVNMEGPVCECGNRGCLDLYASGNAALRYLKDHYGISLESFEQVLENAAAGSGPESEALMYISRNLGIGLASIINIYNPDRIMIAGWVFGAEKNYLKGDSSYRDEIIRTAKSIIPSKIFDETDIEFYEDDIEPTFRGACAVALENILKTSTELISSLREQ